MNGFGQTLERTPGETDASMKCLICNKTMEYYFSKTYSEQPFDEFMRDIGKVEYYRCRDCGFVLSKTHKELDASRWAELNNRTHTYFENPKNERKGNQPPYAEQAMMLALLGGNGIVDTEDMIDYAAGYGTLSKILEKYFKLCLQLFDLYIKAGDDSRYVQEGQLRTYKTVINSAMFEHVLTREDLDRVNQLVASDGCLIVHTHISENVPSDTNWFYLRPPVHTAFHTNKSMEILMRQWGYSSSIYSPRSKCWVLLRQPFQDIERSVRALNEELQTEWFYCKDGFVDYWKGS